MPPSPPARFAVLDLGTARTTLLAVAVRDGRMAYAGHVSRPTQGLRKGLVVSLDSAADVIRQVASELESLTGAGVERVYLSLTGAHVRGLGSQAGISLTSRSREVTRDDTRRVLELARTLSLPDDRQILHVIPQEFVLDHQAGVQDPVGMLASRLEVRLYAISAAIAAKDNLVLAANQAGLEVEELVFAPLAVAEACLRAEDRQAGVALVDLGAGSTGVLVYHQGALAHAAVIPIGGGHFTNDIAVGLCTSQLEAERIKCGFGAASAAYASAASAIEVPSLGDRPPRLMPHRRLCECIEPRAQELIELIGNEVAKIGGLATGIVLSGGGSRLTGLPETMEATLGLPVRIAEPALIEDMPDQLCEPESAFVVGACYWAHRVLARNLAPPSLWDRLRERWAAL